MNAPACRSCVWWVTPWNPNLLFRECTNSDTPNNGHHTHYLSVCEGWSPNQATLDQQQREVKA